MNVSWILPILVFFGSLLNAMGRHRGQPAPSMFAGILFLGILSLIPVCFKKKYKIEFNVNNSVFYPKPKIRSSVISIKIKNTNINLKEFYNFLSEVFKSKRKKLK